VVKVWFAVAIFAMATLVGCQVASHSTTSTPATLTTNHTPAPTATFVPAVDFVNGLVVLPPEKYLFVEAWRNLHGVGNCEGLMIDFPTYNIHDGSLQGNLNLAADASIVGFFGEGTSNSGTAGGGASSELMPMYELPYQYGQFTVHSVDSRGLIVITIDGESIYMEPGRSWSHQTQRTDENGCQLTNRFILRNYGLVYADMGEFRSQIANECPGIDSQRNRLAWSHNENWFAYAGKSSLTIYESDLRSTLQSWSMDAPVTSVAVSPHGNKVAFTTADGALHFVDLIDEEAQLIFDASLIDSPGYWTSLTFNPDGKILALGAADKRILFWDVETSTGNPLVAAAGADRCVRFLEFNSSGNRLLVDAGAESTEVWTIRDNMLTGTSIGGMSEIDGARAITPDGSRVAAVGGGTFFIVNAMNGSVKESWSGAYQNVRSIQFSPDGTLLATGSDYGWVQLWEVEPGGNIEAWMIGDGDWSETVVTVVFSPDGHYLAALDRIGDVGELIWVLDLDTGETAELLVPSE
jgi:WD40 repeat protein